jgi:hypothetical protein
VEKNRDASPKFKEFGGGRKGLLRLLFVLLFALLLNVKLWFFPLFFVTFIFLSNVTHDNYSFLVGLSPQMTDSMFRCPVIF